MSQENASPFEAFADRSKCPVDSPGKEAWGNPPPFLSPVRLARSVLVDDGISEDYPARGDFELADVGLVGARA